MLELDHLAVAATTLEEGREAVEAALGVSLSPGGQHAYFGTHNLLLGLEDGLYLEVIAIDPGAPKPAYPRWFDLDRFGARPQLHIWICRTTDLTGFTQQTPNAGQPVALERGDLRWRMAVPNSGVLPYDNAYPAVMEWQSASHPARRLAKSGCRLSQLVVTHPRAEALADEMCPQLKDPRIVFEEGVRGLRAEFDTPIGRRVLK